MKERPILFSGEMVRAILDGRKTQTRRVVKQPITTRDGHTFMSGQRIDNNRAVLAQCRYGKPGDRLWVRETWGLFDTAPKDGPDDALVFYRATDGELRELRHQLWRPSIHMPRWASRLMLEITNVRVERLNDITYEDALAEGCVDLGHFGCLWQCLNDARPACAWVDNPWVWVLEFKPIKKDLI